MFNNFLMKQNLISDSLNKHLKTGILLFQHSVYLSFKPLNHLNENLSPCFSSFPKLQTAINEHSKSWDFFCYNHGHKCLSQSKHSLFTEQMNESPNTHLLCSKNHASYMAACKPHTHMFSCICTRFHCSLESQELQSSFTKRKELCGG